MKLRIVRYPMHLEPTGGQIRMIVGILGSVARDLGLDRFQPVAQRGLESIEIQEQSRLSIACYYISSK